MKNLYLALFVLFSISQLVACLRENRRWRAVNKPFLLLTLLLWYCAAAARINPLLVAGLALSMLGDVLLIFQGLFKLGGASFFGAHLCYIAAFWQNIALRQPFWLLAVLAYVLFVCLILHAVRGGMKKKMFALTIVYMTAVSAMSFSALLQLVSIEGAAAVVFVGSLLFVASDSMIALREFRRDIPLPKPHFLVMATYIPAQFLIALGMSRIG